MLYVLGLLLRVIYVNGQAVELVNNLHTPSMTIWY